MLALTAARRGLESSRGSGTQDDDCPGIELPVFSYGLSCSQSPDRKQPVEAKAPTGCE